MPRISLVFVGFGLLSAPGLGAQGKPETAAFVVHLGTDTIAVERFTRSSNRLEGDLVARTPRTRLVHYVATIGPHGTIQRIESTSQPYASDAPRQSAVATFRPDTVTEDLRLGDSAWTQQVAVRPGAFPMLNASFALYEQAIRQALASGKDSVNLDLVFMGPNRAFPTAIVRLKPDSMMVEYFGRPAYARIDRQGRLLRWNGLATTVKVLVERVATVDIQALGQAFASRDSAGRGLGMLSPRDTVRATIGDANLLVDYGRPRRRGRVIFGGVVPWGAVWRTGANAATQFSTDRNLVIGGTLVPAGEYTLWTLPSPTGGQLIINSQTRQWGTEYDPAKDLARIPLQIDTLSEPVEQFTISLVPRGPGGVLLLEWERTRYSVGVEVKK